MEPIMNSDLIALLHEFNAHNVDYLIVGAHALAVHGHIRGTKDLDLWIRPESENSGRVLSALISFGAPLHDLTKEDLTHPGIVFQIGMPPFRVDVLTKIDGVEFEDAWNERIETTFGAEPAAVISRRHFVANKRASGRLQDLADIENLEKQNL
jgi:hypothetical protein